MWRMACNGCLWNYLIKKEGLFAWNHNDLRKLDNSKEKPAKVKDMRYPLCIHVGSIHAFVFSLSLSHQYLVNSLLSVVGLHVLLYLRVARSNPASTAAPTWNWFKHIKWCQLSRASPLFLNSEWHLFALAWLKINISEWQQRSVIIDHLFNKIVGNMRMEPGSKGCHSARQ